MRKLSITDYIYQIQRATFYLSHDKEKIENIIYILNKSKENRNTIFICGNGGSALTASHFASDLINKGMRAICLNDNVAVNTAITNDKGWVYTYEEQLKYLYRDGDVLIVISNYGASNKGSIKEHSQNLVRAINYVNERNGFVIGLSGKDGGEFNKCDINLIIKSNNVMVIEPIHSIICHMIPLFINEF